MKNRINIWGQDVQKYGFSISKSGKDPYSGGWIGEFVYYNDVLSTGELTVLRQALSAKWLEE